MSEHSLLNNWIQRSQRLAHSLDRFRAKPETLQLNTLKRLLWSAESTSIGKYYDFNKILRTENVWQAFSEQVPFHDYDSMFNSWWHRSLSGENDVAWPGHIPFYALSSGTTGAPSKYIPVTNEMLRSIQKAGVKCLFSVRKFNVGPDFFTKKMMLLGGTTTLQDMGTHQVGDLSGINIGKTPLWIRLTAKPDPEIASIPDWEERLEQIALNAHKWDVGSISGSPAWNRLMLQRIMEKNKASTIHEVWPNLRVFAHGGVSFEPYRHSFDAMMSKPIAYMDTYLASEGFVAFQNRPGTRSMALVLNNGLFYEFIPFNDTNFDAEGNLIGQPKSLFIGNVTEGTEYALVLSSCAGAWRYLIGDTVRFTDLARAEIVITGRTKHFMSVCGEHLSVGNMSEAISKVQDELEVEIPEFALCARPEGNHFVHTWFIGTSHTVDNEQLKKLLDGHLCDMNDDYKTERTAVLQMEVVQVPLQIFYGWLEQIGKVGGQHKFPRVLKGKQLQDWQSHLQNHGL